MTVAELIAILDEYDKNAKVIGVDWSNGRTYDVVVGSDDEDDTRCCISFE